MFWFNPRPDRLFDLSCQYCYGTTSSYASSRDDANEFDDDDSGGSKGYEMFVMRWNKQKLKIEKVHWGLKRCVVINSFAPQRLFDAHRSSSFLRSPIVLQSHTPVSVASNQNNPLRHQRWHHQRHTTRRDEKRREDVRRVDESLCDIFHRQWAKEKRQPNNW